LNCRAFFRIELQGGAKRQAREVQAKRQSREVQAKRQSREVQAKRQARDVPRVARVAVRVKGFVASKPHALYSLRGAVRLLRSAS